MTWLLLWLSMALAHDGSVRGVTVSCATWGYEWGTDDMVQTLDELKALGVNWIAIHPYARIYADGTVGFKPTDTPPVWLSRPIAEAHARGMKVMIKPHLAYWGSPFPWRGEITFDDDAKWARFFATYQAWVTQLAALTHGADAFAVGTELDKTLAHEAAWREIIASVRKQNGAPLTYAANWTDYERVPFWDALDAVGVQAYFPLTSAGNPSDAELADGWRAVSGKLKAVSDKTGKPVVLTELGYPRSAKAAETPWVAEDDPAYSALQARALRVAIDAMDQSPHIIGAFLWKWFPGDRPPRDFALQREAARAVVQERWGHRE